MSWVLLGLLSAAIGASMGLSGIGGFLVVPLLVTVAAAAPAQAVFAALTVNLAVTLSGGALATVRKGVDYRNLAFMVVGSALGAVLSAWLLGVLSPVAVRLVIAGFLVVLGTAVVVPRRFRARVAVPADPQLPGIALLGLGSLAQVSAALAGIGGPAITVPVLSVLGGSMDRAVGTALVHGAFVSGIGLLVTRSAGGGFDLAAAFVAVLVVATATVVSVRRQRLARVVPFRPVVAVLALAGAAVLLFRP